MAACRSPFSHGSYHTGVGANHGVHLGVTEIVGENVDGVATEQLELVGLQQAVPVILQLDGGREFLRAPEHPHHFAIRAKAPA